MRYLLACGVVAVAAGCASGPELTAPVLPPPPESPTLPDLPGVDSVFTQMAAVYYERAVLDDDRVDLARRLVEGGQTLLALADSLLTQYMLEVVDSSAITDSSRNVAIEFFNEGARVLQEGPPGLTELRAAADQFHLALEANPLDTEALFWLSRVYELQYERLGSEGAIDDAIEVLDRLVGLYPHRHDYTALLASAHESRSTPEAAYVAGGLWHRASGLVVDDAELDPDANIVVDSARVFVYLANASRAFVDADHADMALVALSDAEGFAREADEQDFVFTEREWITWDDQLWTRKRYDELLEQAGSDPGGATTGLEELLDHVTRREAHQDVQHQLSLTLYSAEREEEAIDRIQSLWHELGEYGGELLARVREDFGVMTFSFAQIHLRSGNLRGALAYLLQSESTGYSQAGVAALTLSQLLRNDLDASLEAARRAETYWEQLAVEDQRALLSHMVNLFRRLDDRDQAAAYVERYRAL